MLWGTSMGVKARARARTLAGGGQEVFGLTLLVERGTHRYNTRPWLITLPVRWLQKGRHSQQVTQEHTLR